MVRNSLPEKIEEHFKLLSILCECYDEGNDIIALPIATAIRVLVHDTDKSTSLLSHLGRKESNYLSTNFQNTKGIVQLGLVRMINVGVIDGVGGEAKYWPLCDERYFPVQKQEAQFFTFEEWCNEAVFKNYNFKLTRKDIVLCVANKDGGAHYDKNVSEKYESFRKSYSGGSTLVGLESGVKRGYDNIPIYPAVRQVAYELLNSDIWN